MADHNVLGKKGEDKAMAYLEANGYQVVERNWTFRGYEIDIIAENEEYIVFTEVKTRATDEWGNPEDAVGIQRMRRMINSASHYLKIHQLDKSARFDIISIVWNGDKPEIVHFEDAFMAFL